MLHLCSSSYADTIYGTTGNAAIDGLTWGMGDLLPDYSSPNVSLQINGLSYYYVMSKNQEDEVVVHVRNRDPINGGYIFEEVDDWTGLPGSSIFKYFTFSEVDASYFGDGEIFVDGNGTITDASVVYLYKMDIDDQIVCATPLSSPECPGYMDALYKYLQSLENLSADDPYYDEWVQVQLEREAEIDEEDSDTMDDPDQREEEEEVEKRLRVDPEVGGLVDTVLQDRVLIELASQPTIIPYYDVTIYGGEYQDTLQLDDTLLPDNASALRNLASDSTHRTMVRSQYDQVQ